jgi:hypothetical protein
MSIASELQILSGYVSSLADYKNGIITALGNKGVTATGHNFGDFANDIDSIQAGGITTESLTITENGTYTAPSGKAYTPITVDVGTFHPEPVIPPPSVIPDDLPKDGKTRIHYSIPASATNRTVIISYYGDTSSTQTTIDWEDNTTSTVTTGSGNKYITHTYSLSGEYTATLSVDVGTIRSNNHIYGGTNKAETFARTYIKWIVIGNNFTAINNSFAESCNNLVNIDLSQSTISLIRSSAFRYCTSLTSITLPDTVTQTGQLINYATFMFAYNTHLVKAVLSKNMPILDHNMFYYCANLKEIVFPDTPTTIGNYFATYCYSLEFVNIPDSVTSIGTNTFQNCYNLKTIHLPENITTIPQSFASNCFKLTSINIPDGVTSIGQSAFSYCVNLESIDIPSGVTSIEQSVLSYCYSLKSVTIPNGVTTISNSAFRECRSIESITIPDNVTTIGSSAFSYCYSLKSITLPSGITSIGANAFQNCFCLASITLPPNLTTIGAYTFSHCETLENVTIPNGVTSIGNEAFAYCYGLKNITLPSGVTSIGTSAFRECYSLESVNIPDGVTSIGTYTFYYCYNFTNITIPATVTSIAANAFYGLYACQKIRFERTTPPTAAASSVFSGLNTACIISVPVGSLSAYQSATNYPKSSTYTYIEE